MHLSKQDIKLERGDVHYRLHKTSVAILFACMYNCVKQDASIRLYAMQRVFLVVLCPLKSSALSSTCKQRSKTSFVQALPNSEKFDPDTFLGTVHAVSDLPSNIVCFICMQDGC